MLSLSKFTLSRYVQGCKHSLQPDLHAGSLVGITYSLLDVLCELALLNPSHICIHTDIQTSQSR